MEMSDLIGMIADLILITVLVIDIIATVKLSIHYTTNTKVCEYLLKCWSEKDNDNN